MLRESALRHFQICQSFGAMQSGGIEQHTMKESPDVLRSSPAGACAAGRLRILRASRGRAGGNFTVLERRRKN